jgi:hypothetical protein
MREAHAVERIYIVDHGIDPLMLPLLLCGFANKSQDLGFVAGSSEGALERRETNLRIITA